MDPNEAYIALCNAQCDCDVCSVFRISTDLIEWYEKGGFPAKYPGSNTNVPLEQIKFLQSIVKLVNKNAREIVKNRTFVV